MLPEPNYPARTEQFIGRRDQIEAFEEALRYSTVTRRMASFAVLGDWGIGKSSSMLRHYNAIARRCPKLRQGHPESEQSAGAVTS